MCNLYILYIYIKLYAFFSKYEKKNCTIHSKLSQIMDIANGQLIHLVSRKKHANV